MRDKLIQNVQKKHNNKKLIQDLVELRKAGWSNFHLDLLKKHFSFYRGLVTGEIQPKDNKHKHFIDTIKNWRNAKPSNVHEEIYINYIKFDNEEKIKNKKYIKKEIRDPVWGNIAEVPDGLKQYPSEILQKWKDAEPEQITVYDWYDDLKYR